MTSAIFLSCMWMLSINSIFGSSFNESSDFQGFSSGAMENHNRHWQSRPRERSPYERSSRDSNRGEGRRSQRKQARKRSRSPSSTSSSSLISSAKKSRTPASWSSQSAKIHNDRILLQTEICLAEVNARMSGVASVVAIIPPVLTVGNLPVCVYMIER